MAKEIAQNVRNCAATSLVCGWERASSNHPPFCSYWRSWLVHSPTVFIFPESWIFLWLHQDISMLLFFVERCWTCLELSMSGNIVLLAFRAVEKVDPWSQDARHFLPCSFSQKMTKITEISAKNDSKWRKFSQEWREKPKLQITNTILRQNICEYLF